MGCRLWGCTESDMTDVTWQQQQRIQVESRKMGQMSLLEGRNGDADVEDGHVSTGLEGGWDALGE